MNTRAVAALLLAGAVAAGVAVLSTSDRGPEPAPPPDGDVPETGADSAARTPFVSATQCQACHAEVYAEWEQSYHAMAWTDPMVQALSEGFRKTECIDCHAPQPIHVTGVAKRVAPRQVGRHEGVDCISCHLLEDGVSVAAARDVDTSAVSGACRPRRMPVMAESTVCAGCHNQHETVDEVLASGVGKTCQDCHMSTVARGGGDPARSGRSHVFPGAHDVEMHRKAVRFEAAVEDGVVVARVTNVGAAHHIPTDARHRSYNLWLTALDGRGNILVKDEHLAEFRLYYRDDFKESTQIANQQTRFGRWPIPEGVSGKVVVRLTYALNPEELRLGNVMEVGALEVALP